MKVLVLGGGVIGVTTAWYLNEAGHDVTVIDRQAEPALETSFANGGQISWSSATPWAAPGIPMTALKWLFKPHSPLVLRPRLDPRMWAWLFSMLRNCTFERFTRNRERMVRMARYSYECLKELRRQTGIEYDQSTQGLLVMYRTEAGFVDGRRDAARLQALGIPFRALDADACVAQEPALTPSRAKISGGLYFPSDEAGDCAKFTRELAERAKAKGVRFVLSTTIQRLAAVGDKIDTIETSQGVMRADHYVAACGSYTPLLLAPVGIRLPVYPVKGYSMTLPLPNGATAPLGTLSDETYKVVLTRLGSRLRVAGTAELAGYDLTLRRSRYATLQHVVRDLFPGIANFTQAEYWCGLRPMTPDNPPVLGATPYKNLTLNTGHGTLGWTMACGSGRAVADFVSGRKPDVPLDDYSLARF